MRRCCHTETFLKHDDWSNVQSEEEIKEILRQARIAGPNTYNYDGAGQCMGDSELYEDCIDQAMYSDLMAEGGC